MGRTGIGCEVVLDTDLAALIVVALIFWWLQYSTEAICCGDYDGYYHIKWSRLIWDNLRAGHFPLENVELHMRCSLLKFAAVVLAIGGPGSLAMAQVNAPQELDPAIGAN